MQVTLTHRQMEVVAFIRSRRLPPTIREICRHFGFGSPNGALCHINALERKGIVKRDPLKARSIQVIEDPARTEALAYLASLPTERLTAIYRYERDSDGIQQ